MAKRCALCEKSPASGNNRSHSMRATRRRFLPNLQLLRIPTRKRALTVRVCTRCIRTLAKAPRIRKSKEPVQATA